ncbi:MAG: hypothetical protein KA967_06160, partial [Methanoculleus sp.]|nr:hypothetical protein [Methanoculleus sp.]
PNVMLYSAGVFLRYILAISPALLLLIFASILDASYAFAALILIPAAALLLSRARKKWQTWNMPGT